MLKKTTGCLDNVEAQLATAQLQLAQCKRKLAASRAEEAAQRAGRADSERRVAELSESLAHRHVDPHAAGQSYHEMKFSHEQAITAAEQTISEQRAQLERQAAASRW